MHPKLIWAAILAGLLSSCSLLSPYEEEFSCPLAAQGGTCQSVGEAYATADAKLDGSNGTGDRQELKLRDQRKRAFVGPDHQGGSRFFRVHDLVETIRLDEDQAAANLYRQQTYQRLAQMLDDPGKPMVAPAKTIRVLLLPRQSETGEFLTLPHFRMIMVDQARWVFGDPFKDAGHD